MWAETGATENLSLSVGPLSRVHALGVLLSAPEAVWVRSVGQNRVMCLVMWSACQTRPVRVHERRAGRTGWHGDSCGTTRIVEGHDATCEDRGVRDGLSWCLRVFVSFSGPNLRKCMNVGLGRAGAKMAAAETAPMAKGSGQTCANSSFPFKL